MAKRERPIAGYDQAATKQHLGDARILGTLPTAQGPNREQAPLRMRIVFKMPALCATLPEEVAQKNDF